MRIYSTSMLGQHIQHKVKVVTMGRAHRVILSTLSGSMGSYRWSQMWQVKQESIILVHFRLGRASQGWLGLQFFLLWACLTSPSTCPYLIIVLRYYGAWLVLVLVILLNSVSGVLKTNCPLFPVLSGTAYAVSKIDTLKENWTVCYGIFSTPAAPRLCAVMCGV